MSDRLRIPTRVGLITHDDHRHFGYSVANELVGHEDYASMMALAICGRRIDATARELLNELSVVHTAPDARVWPLRITRVIASYGGSLMGFAVGQLCMEGVRIGPPIARHAALMLAEIRASIGDAIDDPQACEREAAKYVQSKKRLVGYGVPFRPEDERLVTLRRVLGARGRLELPFWRTQEALSAVVRREKKIAPNIGIGTAAMCLDLGFAAHEIGALATFLNQNCFVANAIEGAAQASEVFRKLPDETIEYVGVPPRQSARARRR